MTVTSRRSLRLPLRQLGVALWVGINIGLIAYFQRLPGLPHADWELWNAIVDQPMYDTDTLAPFVWSPVAGWIMQIVATVGVWPWAAVQVGVLLLLRDWRLIALVAVSWGFMDQIASGNTMVFVFVAGVLAFRGRRPAAVVYLALLFLMPRPLQVPLAVWLIWKMPEIRVPAAVVFVIHAALVLASGLTIEWFANMAGHVSPLGNYGPSALIGTVPWLAIGIPLGVWLTWKGRVGWAGLAMSPYWLAGYLIWPLIELPRAKRAVKLEEEEAPGRQLTVAAPRAGS